MHRNAGQLQLAFEVTQGFFKFRLAGNLLGNIKLAAHLVAGFEQGDAVTALRRNGGSGETGRTGTDDRNVLGVSHRQIIQLGLVTGAGIDQTGSQLQLKGVIKAGLVAADTGIDFIGAIFRGLVDELRVREERTGHGNHVRVAGRNYVFAHLWHIDPVAGHHRHTQVLFHLGGNLTERGARYAGGDGGYARFVPANTGVDDVGAGFFNGLAQGHHFVKVTAAFHQVEHGQAINDNELLPNGLAYAAHDFDGQAGAVFKAAAPAVLALVGAGDDELVDEVALGTHDLDAVVAGLTRERGTTHVVVDLLLHFGVAQFLRCEGVDGSLDGGGRDQVGVIGVTAGVQDLHADLAAFSVHSIGDFPVMLGFLRGGHFGGPLEHTAFLVGGNAAGHDQAYTTAGTLGIEGGETGETACVFFQVGVHGAHQDAVFQGGKAQVQGREQVRVGL